MSVSAVLGFLNLGPQEILILLVVGVLLFGRRLPEVGRSLGKGIVEFKKGLNGVEDVLGQETAAPAPPVVPQRVARPQPSAGTGLATPGAQAG
jgi:sec-independent protein translocase protein TatA